MKLNITNITTCAVAVALLCAASSTVFAQSAAPRNPVKRDRIHQHMNGNGARRNAANAQRNQRKANNEAIGHGKLYRQAAANNDRKAAAGRWAARNKDRQAANQHLTARAHNAVARQDLKQATHLRNAATTAHNPGQVRADRMRARQDQRAAAHNTGAAAKDRTNARKDQRQAKQHNVKARTDQRKAAADQQHARQHEKQ